MTPHDARRLRILLGGLLVGLLLAVVTAVSQYRRSMTFERFFSTTLLDPYGLQEFPARPLPAAGATRIVITGDSRAADWPLTTTDPSIEIINRGIHAQSSAQVYGRFDAHVLALQPDVVVLQVGVNDLRLLPHFPQQQDEIMAACRQNIAAMVAAATQNGATVVLTTIFPVGQGTLPQRLNGEAAQVATAVAEVNTFLTTLADEQVIVLDSAAILAGENGRLQPQYEKDFLHINDAGYDALATELWPHLHTLSDS